MGTHYKNPPIMEVLCGFQFKQEEVSFDLLKFNSIYEKIKNDFPEHEHIHLHPIDDEGEVECINGMQFSAANDKKINIRVAPNVLMINISKPYSTWKEFFSLIQDTLKKYHDVFNVKEIIKINLAYLNEVDLIGRSVKIEDYFNFYPSIGRKVPQKIDIFNLEVFIPYEKRGILKMGLTKIAPDPKRKHCYLFEIKYSSIKKEIVAENFDHIFKWLDMAHTDLENAFEDCITQKLRNKFNEDD